MYISLRRTIVPLSLLLAVAAPARAAAGPDPDGCGADLRTELVERTESEDRVDFRFRVDIVAAPACAELSYDFLVEEMLPNRQTKTERKPRHVTLEEGRRSEIVEHSMSTDLELLGYAVRLVDCACAAEPS